MPACYEVAWYCGPPFGKVEATVLFDNFQKNSFTIRVDSYKNNHSRMSHPGVEE
jgi:hypothetical protein